MNYPTGRWPRVCFATAFLSIVAGCSTPAPNHTVTASTTATPVAAAPATPAPAASSPSSAPATKGPGFSLVFVTPAPIVSGNLSSDTLGAWARNAIEQCEAVLARETTPPRVLIQITLKKTGAPDYELCGRPRLSRKLEKSLRDALTQLPALNTPYCDVCFRLQHVDEAAKDPLEDGATFSPKPRVSTNSLLAASSPADISADYAEVRAWAREVALPLLAGTARSVDAKFEGVMNMGKRIGQTDLSQQLDVEAMTFRNPDYWRGVVEMAPGNALVTAMPVCLFVANGEFDKADRLLRYIAPFTSGDSLGGSLLAMLEQRLRTLDRKVEAKIREGIAFHDAGAFDKAEAQYRRLLAVFPCSAWAHYELSFTTLFRESPTAIIEKGEAQWAVDSPGIIACDPMYNMQYAGNRGKSMASMLDRLALQILNEKKNLPQGDRLGRHAEIAMRLEAYGYAAHIYWLSLPYKKSGLREEGLGGGKELTPLATDDVICRFLYCLEKLGCPALKSNFKKDYTAEFKAFDEALAKHRSQ